ncbi:MAG: hypothetical protein V4858_06495 [Pseudomonadota bacterium]
MTVADLISILQQQEPKAIVVQSDPQRTKRYQIAKLGVGEVRPVHVLGDEELGLVWLKLADKDTPGAVPGLLLGEGL